MKTGAIISEFNPFHNGHKFLIKECENHGITHKVAIMSGSFVQRGDLALFSKFERTKTALNNGIDLVVELPVSYALSTAQNFAFGGVEIAHSLNVNTLAFGSECGNIDLIKFTANSLLSENFNSSVKQYLNKGLTFAKARQLAFENTFDKNNSLNFPNDILATEYVMQIIKNGYNILPLAIKRKSVEHDSNITCENYASASFIRAKIENGNFTKIKPFIPTEEYEHYLNLPTANIKHLENAILIKLKSSTADYLKTVPDINEGLENKIITAANNSVTLEQLYGNIKSKRYTLTRIKRAVLSAFLGIDKQYFKAPVPYIRVLGFNKKGLEIIKNANADIPIVLRSAELKTNPLFKKEMFATDCFNLCLEKPKAANQDLTEGVIKS